MNLCCICTTYTYPCQDIDTHRLCYGVNFFYRISQKVEHMSKIRESFGKRVKELRKAKKMSQEELGERVGLHYTYVGGVERGERNISLESIEKIAKGLEVNIGELFPFVSKKGKIPEMDSLRNEIVNLIYECDKETLKLSIKVIKEIKDSSEAKD